MVGIPTGHTAVGALKTEAPIKEISEVVGELSDLLIVTVVASVFIRLVTMLLPLNVKE